MTQSRKLRRILKLVALVLISAASALAAGDDQTTTITVTNDPNATLLLILEKGPKGVTPPPVTVPASQAGTFVIGPPLAGDGALPVGLEIYDCGDGHYVAAQANLPLDQIPCPGSRKPKPLGYIPPGGNATIDGQAQTLTVTSAGAAAQTATHIPFTVQLYGGVGFTKFTSANTCRSILDELPDALCHSHDKSFAFSVGGSLEFTRYFGLRAGYTRANSITRDFTSTSPSNLTAKDTFQPGYFTLMPEVFVPLGPLNFFAEGGLAYHRIHLFERQSVNGGPPITTSLHNSGAGFGFGGGLEWSLKKNLGLRFEYQYLASRQNDLFSMHNHVATFGAYFKFW